MTDDDNVLPPAEIDLNDLPGECVRQPRLYFRFSQELADAKRELAETEAELEIVEAELQLEMRKDPASFGLAKPPPKDPKKEAKDPTEAMFKAAIRVDERVQKLGRRILKRKHRVDSLSGYVTMLEHRKRMIEKLVDMRINNLYAEPIVPGKYKEEVREENAASARSKIKLRRPEREE